MASPAAWLAGILGSLWLGSTVAILARFAVSLSILIVAAIALAVILAIAMGKGARRLAGLLVLALIFLAGLWLALSLNGVPISL